MTLTRLLFVAALLFSVEARGHSSDAVGGGVTDGGWVGAYFSNVELRGEPAFTRREVRIDFDWGRLSPVGGSTAEPYASFPRDAFSARWTGALLPAFTEAYRFVAIADDAIRVRVRASEDAPWMTVLEGSGQVRSEALPLERGQPLLVEIEYAQRGDDARCALYWESPSTPREVIDPVRQQGINANAFADYTWANLVKTARFTDAKTNALGWPTSEGSTLVLSEMQVQDSELAGTYALAFDGQSKVSQDCCCRDASFRTETTKHGSVLPRGAGYDPKTGRTTALLEGACSRVMLKFSDAVTGIEARRPLKPNAQTPHPDGAVTYAPFREVVSKHFTLLRWLDGANDRTEAAWKDRTLPAHAHLRREHGHENWEHLVMLANETGRDLYITTPVGADDAYFESLARLIRFGSDGRAAYTRETESPMFPPLNPNLRIYVEVGNEIWNWAFPSTSLARELAERSKGTDAWKLIDFDGSISNPGSIQSIRRWHALRTVRMSEAFLRVFGQDALPARVRPVLPYQYDDMQVTASTSLGFLARAFEGRAPSDFLYGAGGASYYGLANGRGILADDFIENASFESPRLEDGAVVLDSETPGWTFRGAAGIVRPAGRTATGGIEGLSAPQAGQQSAVILPGGSMAQRVRFPKPGRYALVFNASGPEGPWPGHLVFDISVDDRSVNPRAQADIRSVAIGEHWNLRGWARDIKSLKETYGSAVFTIEDADRAYTIRFSARADGASHVQIDAVELASVSAIFESDFSVGEAQGQGGDASLRERLERQALFARAFGLLPIAYEAGWSVGGDFKQIPIQNAAKLSAEEAKRINDRMIDIWYRSGSFMNVWGVYSYFPAYDMERAWGYPIMNSIMRASRTLPPSVSFGHRPDMKLTPANAHWRSSWQPEGWLSWFFSDASAPDSFAWMIAADASRTVRLELDGSEEVDVRIDGVAAERGTETFLTRGAHAVRVILSPGASFESIRLLDGRL